MNNTEYLLVDGYNIIHAWPELKELVEQDMHGARLALQDMLCNYQGYKNNVIIVVYDAYHVKGNQGSVEKYYNIQVVFTKEAQTADEYIEQTVELYRRDKKIFVATSDWTEQIIIMGKGAVRVSAMDLKEDMQIMNQVMKKKYEVAFSERNTLMDNIDPNMAAYLEKLRRGLE